MYTNYNYTNQFSYAAYSKQSVNAQNVQQSSSVSGSEEGIVEEIHPENINEQLGKGDWSALEALDKHNIPYTKEENDGVITIKYEYKGVNYTVNYYPPETKSNGTGEICTKPKFTLQEGDGEIVTKPAQRHTENIVAQPLNREYEDVVAEPLSLERIAGNSPVMNPEYNEDSEGNLKFEDETAEAVYTRIQLDLKDCGDEKTIANMVAEAWINAYNDLEDKDSVGTAAFIRAILNNILSKTNSEAIRTIILEYFDSISAEEKPI